MLGVSLYYFLQMHVDLCLKIKRLTNKIVNLNLNVKEKHGIRYRKGKTIKISTKYPEFT